MSIRILGGRPVFTLLVSLGVVACSSREPVSMMPSQAEGGCAVEIRNATELPMEIRYSVPGQPPIPLGEVFPHQSHNVVVDCESAAVVVHAMANVLVDRSSRGDRYKQAKGTPKRGETVVITIR